MSIRDILNDAGFATVMDIAFYKAESNAINQWDSVKTFATGPIATLKTLKMTDLNMEGPTKQATGGKNNSILLNYGKTCTFAGQDALGDYNVLTNMLGAELSGKSDILAITDFFNPKLTFVGSTFTINKLTGQRQFVYVIIPFMLPQAVFNLTQEAEGDISTFDINGAIQSFYETEPQLDGCKYTSGGDKSFYFFSSKDTLEEIKKFDFAQVVNSDEIVTVKTFADIIAPEAGKNYVVSSENYRVYSYDGTDYTCEAANLAELEAYPGHADVIYIAVDTGLDYMWDGNAYAEIL